MIKEKIKKMAGVLVIFSLLVGVTGCGDSAASARGDAGNLNQAKEVRIMSPSNYFPIIIAYEKGFFQEAFGEDVDVSLLYVNGGSVIMESMTAGEVDFGALGDMPIIQARRNGLDVKVISTLFSSTSGYELIAAENSGINSIQDLVGRNVAVMSGSTSHKLFLKYLESEGLAEDDIEVMYLKDSDQLAAFVGGGVDAAVAQVPTSTKIIEETGAYSVMDAEGYDIIRTYIVGDNAFMQENPAYAEAYLSAIIKATDWIENNFDEAVQIVSEVSETDIDKIELYYQTRTYEYALGEGEAAGLEDTIDYLYDQGTIDEKVDVNELIDASYLNAAQGVK